MIATRITKRTLDAAVVPRMGFHFPHGLLAGIVVVLVLPRFPFETLTWILGPGPGFVRFAITLVTSRAHYRADPLVSPRPRTLRRTRRRTRSRVSQDP